MCHCSTRWAGWSQACAIGPERRAGRRCHSESTSIGSGIIDRRADYGALFFHIAGHWIAAAIVLLGFATLRRSNPHDRRIPRNRRGPAVSSPLPQQSVFLRGSEDSQTNTGLDGSVSSPRRGCCCRPSGDETLWGRSYILSHREFLWSIVTLCRTSDTARAKVSQPLGDSGRSGRWQISTMVPDRRRSRRNG